MSWDSIPDPGTGGSSRVWRVYLNDLNGTEIVCYETEHDFVVAVSWGIKVYRGGHVFLYPWAQVRVIDVSRETFVEREERLRAEAAVA